MKGSFSKEIYTGSNDYRTLSLKYFSQMTFIFSVFLGNRERNQKNNKKSIYLRKHKTSLKNEKKRKKIDDDFIFVGFLCWCLFKIYAKENRKKSLRASSEEKLSLQISQRDNLIWNIFSYFCVFPIDTKRTKRNGD